MQTTTNNVIFIIIEFGFIINGTNILYGVASYSTTCKMRMISSSRNASFLVVEFYSHIKLAICKSQNIWSVLKQSFQILISSRMMRQGNYCRHKTSRKQINTQSIKTQISLDEKSTYSKILFTTMKQNHTSQESIQLYPEIQSTKTYEQAKTKAYQNYVHRLRYLKALFERQQYFTNQMKTSNQQPQSIESCIENVQKSQSSQYLNRFKSEKITQFIDYTYEKAKFYHFRFQYIRAFKVFSQLQQYSAHDLQKASISTLNMKIFKYLTIVCHYNHDCLDNQFQEQSQTYLRDQYFKLLTLINKFKLNQDQKSQMIVFVSSLYYNYAIAKWNQSNQSVKINNFTDEIALKDYQPNDTQLKEELQSLAALVLRFGLQLVIKDRLVQRVQFVQLNPQLFKKSLDKQRKSWQVNTGYNKNKQYFVVGFQGKSSYIQKQPTQLKNLNAENEESVFFAQSGAFHRMQKDSKDKQKLLMNNFYFLNLQAVYISKSSLDQKSKSTSKWIKMYQRRQIYRVRKQFWQAFQRNSLTISIKKSTSIAASTINQKELKKITNQILKVFNKFYSNKKGQEQDMSSSKIQVIYAQSSQSTQVDENSKKNKDNINLKGRRTTVSTDKNKSKDEQNDINVAKATIRMTKAKSIGKLGIDSQQASQAFLKSERKLINYQFVDYVKMNFSSQVQNTKNDGSQSRNSHPSHWKLRNKSKLFFADQTSKNFQKEEKKNTNNYDRGFVNLGNTCYMNSALQCLHKTRHFTQKISLIAKGIKQKYKKSRTYQLTDLFQALIGQMWLNKNPFDAWEIKEVMGEKNYQFKHFNQSDATEFVLTFLLIISKELNNPTELQEKQIDQYNEPSQRIYEKIKFNQETYCKSIVEETFTGRYKVVYSSNNPQSQCQHKYTLFEKFNVHYVEIPPKSQFPSLQCCLAYTKKTDHLKTEDRMTCDLCQATTLDTKNMEILEAGQILVLSFKRFLNGRKNEADIKVPETLEPREVVCESQAQSYKGMNYKLYGAIIHYGGLQGGHYFSLCFNYKSGKWMKYNDSSVTQISQNFQQIDFSKAMTLFYQLNTTQQQVKQQPSKTYTKNFVVNESMNVDLLQLSEIKSIQNQSEQEYQNQVKIQHHIKNSIQKINKSFLKVTKLQQQIINLQAIKCILYSLIKGIYIFQCFRKNLLNQKTSKGPITKLLLQVNEILTTRHLSNDDILRLTWKQSIYKLQQAEKIGENKLTHLIKHYIQQLDTQFGKRVGLSQKYFQITEKGYYKCVKGEHSNLKKKLIHKLAVRQDLWQCIFVEEAIKYSNSLQTNNATDRLCPQCKGKLINSRTMLYETKTNLIISIQKDANNKNAQSQQIIVPRQLKVADIISQHQQQLYKDAIYSLVAVISLETRFGKEQYSVQYYDYLKSKWLTFDGEQAEEMKEARFPKATILFYQLTEKDYEKTELSMSTKQKEIFSMICSVTQWLVRSYPFQEQFNKRVEMLRNKKIPLKEDLAKFESMIKSGQVDKAYIFNLVHKRQSIFEPAFYSPDRSQVQNFITSVLQMLSQAFLESSMKISAFWQKEFKQDLKYVLLQTESYKTYYFKCKHKGVDKSKVTLSCQKVKFTGIKQQDCKLVNRYFNNKRKYDDKRSILCSSCGTRQYQCYLQPFKINKLLMVQLQRFKGQQKNETLVEVPLELQVSKIITEYKDQRYKNKVYRISAVICHKGSVEEGQYFVQCYDFKKLKWTHCVNEDTNQMSSNKHKFENAYCLVYELVLKDPFDGFVFP